MIRAVVLVLLVAACSSRYGTYLRITSDQKFDRIELYFGVHEDGDMVPATPNHRAVATIAGQAYLAKRLVAATDTQQLAAPVLRFDYYLPDDDDNAKLGDVVVAVAYAGQTPVGIGELRDFTVVGDEVWIYKLALRAYDASAEVWGRPAADCVRWLDPDRGETVAIVRGGDSDCDTYPDKEVDCDPLAYCGGHAQDPGCASGLRCLAKGDATDATGPCSIGTCVNGDDLPNDPQQCTPELCVPQAACDCMDGKPVPEQVACALDSPTTHGVDYAIVIRGGGALCHEPYEVDITPPDMRDCAAPHVEAVTPSPVGSPEHFTFVVENTGNGFCHLTIVPDVPGAKYTLHHLLISYDTGEFPRSTFVVGLGPGTGVCEEPITVMQSQTGECPAS